LLAFIGIVAGLVIGKPLGVIAASVVATRFGLATLPSDITWTKLVIVGTVAGIGFTMSIFIAELALSPGFLLETSKLAILVASATAAVVALGLGRLLLRPVADGREPG
jgi:NhaA family Na+:H+ antiporter